MMVTMTKSAGEVRDVNFLLSVLNGLHYPIKYGPFFFD
jgi:hypothetical protein